MTSYETDTVQGAFISDERHVDVAVVVVTYNSAADIGRLLHDLRAAALVHAVRVLVVDNQSGDDTCEIVRRHPDVSLIDAGGNLGYAGGINCALPLTGSCDSVLILNPDLRVLPGAVEHMLATLESDRRIGIVVPRILDEDGHTYPSLRFEPTTLGVVGDALFGRKFWLSRPRILSEVDYRAEHYSTGRQVDWATGAALLIRGDVARRLGAWDEQFFLYSEEVEYFRRVRDCGLVVRYEPTAVVQHRLGGSGTSPALAALIAVNRVRYVELTHGKGYSAIFRCAVVMAEMLRGYDPTHRQTLAILVNRRRWLELPAATRRVVDVLPGPRRRGAVIIPAYNEAKVIAHTLSPLSEAAVDGFFELIVVCNGCTDDTADVTRKIPGVQVLELDTGSKTMALNAGDGTANLWPRLYLDADIEITSTAVLAVLDQLSDGSVLAARPAFRYGTYGADMLVRSYYRARTRIGINRDALWWAGVYGLSEQGHRRFGAFPDVTGDDKYVDSQFTHDEKAVTPTDPSIWVTPTDVGGLLAVLRRHNRGNAELAHEPSMDVPRTERATALAVLRTAHGPRSGVDAAIYLGVSIAARRRVKNRATWERDDTSRAVR